MARSSLTLAVVVLVLAASQEQGVSSSFTSRESNEESSSLLCVTLVKPQTQNITLIVHDSSGVWNVTAKLNDDCSPKDKKDLLAAEVVKTKAQMFHLKARLGDCVMECWTVRTLNAAQSDITRYPNESVVCLKSHLWPFRVEVNTTTDSCTTVTMRKHTNQQMTSWSTDSPHTSAEPSVAPEKAPTPTTLPPPAVVLLTVLVVEVVATCVTAGIMVVVLRGERKTIISPATTDVRRVSSKDDMYISENELYEPFPDITAAEQERGVRK